MHVCRGAEGMRIGVEAHGGIVFQGIKLGYLCVIILRVFLDRTVLIFIFLLHCQTHDGRLRSKSTQQSFSVLLFPCHLQLHHLWYNLTHGMIWDLSVLTGDNVARSMYHGWGAVCTVRSLHSFTLSRSDRSSADSRCLKLLYFTQRPLETLKTFSQSSGASQHLETHHPDIWGWHCHS